jgi:protoporphyrinogen oxidase
MDCSTDILVVGAGLSGLSAACHLDGGLRLRFIEKELRPGGLAVTDEVRGFRFDRTGHLLHLRHPHIKRWILGLMGRRLRVIHRQSRIWSHGVYTRYPFQSNTFGLPPRVARECLLGYLEARENPPRRPARTFLDFINAHFGKGFARHFMIPYNRKIWGVHPRDMTAAWCDRFVPVPLLEDVIDGAVGLHERELGYNVAFHYPASGIGLLAERLAQAARKRAAIEYGTGLASVDFRRRRAVLSSGETVRYERMISTLPLKVLGRLLEGAPGREARAFSLLRCNPLRYLDVALRRPSGTPYHWCYVPHPAVPFYRVGSYSNFSADLVPRGRGSLYVEMASRRPIDLKRTLPVVAAALEEMRIIRRPSDILFAIPKIIDYAYVVYDRHYMKAVPLLHGFLERHGIFSTGRYGNWNYSAMEDALVMGMDAARRAAV